MPKRIRELRSPMLHRHYSGEGVPSAKAHLQSGRRLSELPRGHPTPRPMTHLVFSGRFPRPAVLGFARRNARGDCVLFGILNADLIEVTRLHLPCGHTPRPQSFPVVEPSVARQTTSAQFHCAGFRTSFRQRQQLVGTARAIFDRAEGPVAAFHPAEQTPICLQMGVCPPE